jgi:CubicO group peptidase (beta-lactamase class C family)
MRTWPAFNGAGALKSTMNDMMKFLDFNMGVTRSSLSSLLPALQEPRHDAKEPGHFVGLAWEMMPLGAGRSRTVIWKNGATDGFSAYIGFVRDTSTGVVILANQRFPVSRLGVRILRLLNPAPAVPKTTSAAVRPAS